MWGGRSSWQPRSRGRGSPRFLENVVRHSLPRRGQEFREERWREGQESPPPGRRVPHYEDDPHWVSRHDERWEPRHHQDQHRHYQPREHHRFPPRDGWNRRGEEEVRGKQVAKAEPPMVLQGIPHLQHSFVMTRRVVVEGHENDSRVHDEWEGQKEWEPAQRRRERGLEGQPEEWEEWDDVWGPAGRGRRDRPPAHHYPSDAAPPRFYQHAGGTEDEGQRARDKTPIPLHQANNGALDKRIEAKRGQPLYQHLCRAEPSTSPLLHAAAPHNSPLSHTAVPHASTSSFSNTDIPHSSHHAPQPCLSTQTPQPCSNTVTSHTASDITPQATSADHIITQPATASYNPTQPPSTPQNSTMATTSPPKTGEGPIQGGGGAVLEHETERYYDELIGGEKKEEQLSASQVAEITVGYRTEAEERQLVKEQEARRQAEEAEVREKTETAWSVLHQYWQMVQNNPYDFSSWTYLLTHVETMDNLEAIQSAFDGFLPLYPYCFAYWKKLSDLEEKHSQTRR